MTKQKLIPVLSIVLLLQLLLAGGLYWARSSGNATAAGEKLIKLDFSKIDGVRIEDGESTVVLKRENQEWRLPDIDFPAGAAKLQGFLDKLASLEKSWPVARTGDAAERFKVADDNFERKVTLSQGEDSRLVVYLGTSPSYRNLHVRLDGQDEIYSVELNSYETTAKLDDWIDKEILKKSPDDIQVVSVDGLTVKKQDSAWMLDGLKEDEQTNQQQVRSLVNKIAAMRIDDVLGKEEKKEYGLDKPDHTISLQLTDDKTDTYRIAKPEGESYFVLKSSAHEEYLRVPGYVLNPVFDTGREKLVQPKEEKTEAPAEEEEEDTAAEDGEN